MNRLNATASVVLIALALSGTRVAADALDLSLNDDAARLSYAWDDEARGLRYDAGWLHHQDRGDVINLGFHLVGEASPGSNPVTGGLGGKVFYIDPDGADVDAIVLGIGGFLRYSLPNYDRINISGHAYFAPDVLAFGDGKRYQEFEARIGYNVLREADIYLGVRYANARFEPSGRLTIDNGLHAGIQLRF